MVILRLQLNLGVRRTTRIVNGTEIGFLIGCTTRGALANH